MKKVLVTGGAGFIGSHLCEKLYEKGYDVSSLDNYSTGSRDNHIEGVKYFKGDTRNINEIITFSPETVYHLGEYSRVEQSFSDVEDVWKYNKDGTFSVLQFCREKSSKIVYAGSSTKYGDGGMGRNQSPYAWSKASNTELVVNYGSWYNLDYAITYFYNVYGGREIKSGRYATLIGIFTSLYKQNKPLTVVKPGTQRRNFTHIDDIISGLIKVGESGSGDEFGIGCSKSYSILEIAEMFETDIAMIEERRGNRMSSHVLCDKTKGLGWRESKDIRKYISKIIGK